MRSLSVGAVTRRFESRHHGTHIAKPCQILKVKVNGYYELKLCNMRDIPNFGYRMLANVLLDCYFSILPTLCIVVI
ncbi:MAG: hypothetical protein ACYTFE_03455 [Planctomycetota bacterium]|jgi:hypothetical protein